MQPKKGRPTADDLFLFTLLLVRVDLQTKSNSQTPRLPPGLGALSRHSYAIGYRV